MEGKNNQKSSNNKRQVTQPLCPMYILFTLKNLNVIRKRIQISVTGRFKECVELVFLARCLVRLDQSGKIWRIQYQKHSCYKYYYIMYIFKVPMF